MNLLSTYIFEKLKLKIDSSLSGRIRQSKTVKAAKYFKFVKFLQNLIYLPDIEVAIIHDDEDDERMPIGKPENWNGLRWIPPYKKSDKNYGNAIFSLRVKYNEADLAKDNKSTFLEGINNLIDEKLYRYESITDNNYYLILNYIEPNECKYLTKIGFTEYPFEDVLENHLNKPSWSYGYELYQGLKPYYDKYGCQIVFIKFADLLKNIDYIYDEFYDEKNDAVDEDPETIEDIKDDGEIENNE